MKRYEKYFIADDDRILGFFEDYRFLSNFHLCPIEYRGVIYPSSENLYQALKSTNYEDWEQFVTCTPPQAKTLGQPPFPMRVNWEEVKYDVMRGILFDKFFQNPELRAKLIATGDKFLQETNHWGDNIWGCDYRCSHGKNWLGLLLMEVRHFLR